MTAEPNNKELQKFIKSVTEQQKLLEKLYAEQVIRNE